MELTPPYRDPQVSIFLEDPAFRILDFAWELGDREEVDELSPPHHLLSDGKLHSMNGPLYCHLQYFNYYVITM